MQSIYAGLFRAFVILLMATFASDSASCQTDLSKGVWTRIEPAIRVAYDEAILSLKKRLKEKHLENDGKSIKAAYSVARFLLYNKAHIYAQCYLDAASLINAGELTAHNGDSRWEDFLTKCREAKLNDMLKYNKPSSYYETFGQTKLTACELKSRLFDEEIKFPPYDFLKDDDLEVTLFDFSVYNSCLIEK